MKVTMSPLPFRLGEHPANELRYGDHTARPTGMSDIGPLAVGSERRWVCGYEILGTSTNRRASMDPGHRLPT